MDYSSGIEVEAFTEAGGAEDFVVEEPDVVATLYVGGMQE
jgi:hypothetical protein